MDRNQVILVGKIGGKLVERKTQTGSTFVFFPFALENKEAASDPIEANYRQDLHIMVFRKYVIDYLKKVGAKAGNRCCIFGFMSSFKTEINGKTIISNALNATDVFIIKTRSDADIINSSK